MDTFDLLIFDCDGVLVDSEPISARAHKAAYAAHGVAFTDEMMSRYVGKKQKDIIAQVAQETGFTLPDASIPQIWQHVEREMKESLQSTPGITDFLKRDRRMRCVGSSSAMERIAFSLKKTDIYGLFSPDRIFSSSMVKHGKPAPDLFLHAAQVCGFAPSTCAVFEDSIYGIQAALAAGMTPLGYVGGSHCGPGYAEKLKQAGAKKVYASWQDVARDLRD